MANIATKDATSTVVYVKSSGAGSDVDPHIVQHLETNSAAIAASLSVIDDWDSSDACKIVGPAAHDAAVSGNPILVGFEAKDFDGAALPNAVSAEADIVRAAASLSGVQYVMVVNEDGSAVGTITVNAHAVTNAGTFAVQVDGAALTALQLIDDAIFAEDVAAQAADKGIAVLAVRRDADTTLVGTDNDYANLQVDANGYLKVEIFDGGGSHTVDNAGTFAVQVDGAALTSLQLIDDAVSGAGFNITQLGGVNITMGNGASGTGVQRVTVANDSTGILAGVTTVTTVTTVSTLTGGGIAHDSADSGNPHKIGAKAALTLSDDTMVADADRTNAVSDADGTLLTRPQFPLADLVSERVSNTDGASTALTNFGATASTRNVITAIVIVNTSATMGYVDFRDGTAGAILYTVPIPATGGAVLPAGGTPYFKTTANTALAFDVSAALTTVYISLSGFKSKVV